MDRLMLKQRVVGALVLLSLAIIFLPLFFGDDSGKQLHEGEWLPPRPQVEEFGEYEPERVEWSDPTEQELWTETDQVEETPLVKPSPPVADKDLPKEPALQAQKLPEAWTVQLATFSKQDNANALTARLQKAGYQAYSKEIRSNQGPMTRVFVGPELVADDAKLLREKLKKKFKLDGIVVHFKP